MNDLDLWACVAFAGLNIAWLILREHWRDDP